jgi:hypothetical protein
MPRRIIVATTAGGADMAKTKQLTVTVENRLGAVAGIARTLGNANVNILALSGTAQGTSGTIELIVEDVRRAKKALDEAKFAYREIIAEEYELPNKPGALAQMLEKLANRDVNLNSIYATAPKGGKKAVVICTVESATKAAAATA